MNGRGAPKVPPHDPKRAIAREIYVAMKLADVPAGLPGEIGAWADGEEDADVLHELREYAAFRVESYARLAGRPRPDDVTLAKEGLTSTQRAKVERTMAMVATLPRFPDDGGELAAFLYDDRGLPR